MRVFSKVNFLKNHVNFDPKNGFLGLKPFSQGIIDKFFYFEQNQMKISFDRPNNI